MDILGYSMLLRTRATINLVAWLQWNLSLTLHLKTCSLSHHLLRLRTLRSWVVQYDWVFGLWPMFAKFGTKTQTDFLKLSLIILDYSWLFKITLGFLSCFICWVFSSINSSLSRRFWIWAQLHHFWRLNIRFVLCMQLLFEIGRNIGFGLLYLMLAGSLIQFLSFFVIQTKHFHWTLHLKCLIWIRNLLGWLLINKSIIWIFGGIFILGLLHLVEVVKGLQKWWLLVSVTLWHQIISCICIWNLHLLKLFSFEGLTHLLILSIFWTLISFDLLSRKHCLFAHHQLVVRRHLSLFINLLLVLLHLAIRILNAVNLIISFDSCFNLLSGTSSSRLVFDWIGLSLWISVFIKVIDFRCDVEFFVHSWYVVLGQITLVAAHFDILFCSFLILIANLILNCFQGFCWLLNQSCLS